MTKPRTSHLTKQNHHATSHSVAGNVYN